MLNNKQLKELAAEFSDIEDSEADHEAKIIKLIKKIYILGYNYRCGMKFDIENSTTTWLEVGGHRGGR